MTPRLLVVVADGVRPDILADEIEAGRAPAMARLCERGGMFQVSSSFPSVTGPAYVPFVMGRHPASAGMPGLRWFDRTRSLPWSLAPARSYSGIDIWQVDRDLNPEFPTLFELAQPSLAGLMIIGRGASHGRIGRGIWSSVKAAYAHFRGDLLAWRQLERSTVNQFLHHLERTRPRLAMLGVLTPDKFAHAFGCDCDLVRESIRDIDAAIARAEAIAERGGWRDTLRVWVVGDHGHAPVSNHDDLHLWLESQGHRVLAHPNVNVRRADMALMVGGNSMAHLYLEPDRRTRGDWPQLSSRWGGTLQSLLDRPSVDLAAVTVSADRVRVFHEQRGVAEIVRAREGETTRWTYCANDGDPLQLGGTLHHLDAEAAWEACATSDYPDAVVQLSTIMTSSRSGDIVLSAAKDWDLRARFEPTPHVSTHGALLREQMMVPLIVDRPVARRPQRTTDMVPSALEALGVDAGHLRFEGRSFF